MRMDRQSLLEKLGSIQGNISFYYKNLVSGEIISYREKEPMKAASVIKIPILAEAFYQMQEGRISGEDLYTLKNSDKEPSCGALNRMHEGLEVSVRDLCNLMIILSDNSATNILIRMLGQENINRRLE